MKLPLGHSLPTSETMHRQTRATAQIKPAKMKQHTSHGLYLAIKLAAEVSLCWRETVAAAAQCEHTLYEHCLILNMGLPLRSTNWLLKWKLEQRELYSYWTASLKWPVYLSFIYYYPQHLGNNHDVTRCFVLISISMSVPDNLAEPPPLTLNWKVSQSHFLVLLWRKNSQSSISETSSQYIMKESSIWT